MLITLAFSLLLTFALYYPAASGSFHFDDPHTLGGLLSVHDPISALRYIFSGDTGPSGRPLALASFLIHLDAWPSDPRPFLITNIALHLINGILVFLLSSFFARALGKEQIPHPDVFALFVAFLWLVMPVHAATNLTVVQRMTSLSAFFVLSGMLVYFIGRNHLPMRPRIGAFLMFTGIMVFTPLAILTKENGAILPLYVLVAEITLLNKSFPLEFKRYRALLLSLLAIPSLALLAYILWATPWASDIAHTRINPAGVERLLVQAHALLDYLIVIVAPTPLAISPFYDDYSGSHLLSPLIGTYLLLLGWLSVAVLAITTRNRLPVLSFTILWFLGGHVLESTSLPLEHFFLHRTYLPSFSIAFAIAYISFKNQVRASLGARVLLVPYLVLLSLVLFEVSNTWGKPQVAGEMWLIERPASLRAAEFLTNRYRAEGDHVTANRIVRASFSHNRDDTGAALDYLGTYCAADGEQSREDLLALVQEVIVHGKFAKRTTQKLDSMIAAWQRGDCPTLDYEQLQMLVESLLKHPVTAASALQTHNVHLLNFRLYYHAGNEAGALDSLKAGHEAYRNQDTLELLVEFFLQLGLVDEAAKSIELAEAPQTWNRFIRMAWEARVRQIRAKIEDVDASRTH